MFNEHVFNELMFIARVQSILLPLSAKDTEAAMALVEVDDRLAEIEEEINNGLLQMA